VGAPTLERTLVVLARTPAVLRAWLPGLEEARLRRAEGPGTYSAVDVVGHLVHGEETDWVVRIEHLMQNGEEVPFVPFERDGMRTRTADWSPEALVERFERLRGENLGRVRGMGLTEKDLARRRGRHPELGVVTLGQLLATWEVHDLAHLGQIARVLAKGRVDEIGRWREYFPRLG
jgi:hypothetical protein